MKTTKNTKAKIIEAAWQLFYEKGYEETTVEEIVKQSGTSKGSFYHYFDGKDSLLGSLAYVFDKRYDELEHDITPEQNRVDVLLYLNRQLLDMIENSIDLELLSRLFATQLLSRGEKELLDRNRSYFKLLRRIVSEGQQRGEITKNKTVTEIMQLYAMAERALLYDWCLHNGGHSLVSYAGQVMPMILNPLRTDKSF